MASISAPGIGSGLDINSLVSQLVQAQADPAIGRLDRREAGLQTRISSYGLLKSALSEFKSGLSGVTTPQTFTGRQASVSDADVLTVSASSTAQEGSFDLQVNNLARSQTLASKAFGTRETVLGEGTVSIRFGTYDAIGNTFTADAERDIVSITIDATNSSLEGIAGAINEATPAISASIVNDGGGERLVVTSSETGLASSLQITVSADSDGNNIDDAGLSQIAYDPTTAGVGSGANLSEAQSALDASFSVNGLAVTRGSNTVTGVIDGVTLTLLDDSSGNSVNVSVSRDAQNVTGSVENFIAAYNDLMATFESLGGYNAETQTGGALLGDALLRNIERSLRGATTGFVDGLETRALRSLPDIGITTNAEGRLELDSSKLSAALDSAPEVIGNLFAATAFMSDSSVEFTGSTAASTPGLYAVTLTNLATRGAYTGDALASLTVNATNDALSVVVDGIQSNTVNLEQKTYSDGNALAAELQSKINADSALGAEGASVNVAFAAGKLVISSAAYGSDSNVTIASSDTDTLTTLGIGTGGGTSAGGTDIAGTLGGFAASGVGQTLTGSGDTAGLSVKVTGGNTGFRGDLTFSRGVGATLLELADVYLDTDAALESSIGSLTERVEALAGDREDLQVRLEATEARLRSQFAALDGLLAQLQSTSTFLTQQLSALPTPGR